MMQTVLVVTGPTGAGKSDLVLRLAEDLPIEIISMDSAQVYRGLDIGTAKPSAAVRARVPHHLIDIREPHENYSAGDFFGDVAALIPAIVARGSVPVIAGGTMLYLRALVRGLSELPRAAPDVRAAIDAEAARVGWPSMHAELASVDPVAAQRIHTNDPQRIQRALEVFRTTGQSLTHWHERGTGRLPYKFERWALVPDRAALHQRIADRYNAMVSAGFVEEVRDLHCRGNLTAQHSSIRSVGYRQIWSYLAGEWDLDTAHLKSVAATRQLAKRQMTWLRSDPEVAWHDPTLDSAFAALRSRLAALHAIP
jgi:tRNA dimethylallyltransferase